MAMYELIVDMVYDSGSTDTPNMLNVFTYTDAPDATVTGDVDALLDAFEENIVPLYQDAMPTQCRIVGLLGRNVYDPYMFQDRVLSVNGDIIGDTLPPYVAVLVRSPRLAVGVRRLRKFLFPPTEGQQNKGVLTTDALNAYQAIADGLADEIEDSSSGRDFRLVLARKERYIISGSSPIRYAWRYFDTLTEQLNWTLNVTDLQVDQLTTTMRSRMYGRGT